MAALQSRRQRDTGTDAELVAFRVGHGDPAGVGSLADVDASSTELFESFGFGLDVGDAYVEVDASLGRLRLRDTLQDDRRVFPGRREQDEVRGEHGGFGVA